MILFGIQLTLGHLIVAVALVILYDALWTWAFNNSASEWWFERVQGWLKLAIYMGAVGLTVLAIYVPAPWNLVLVIAVLLSVLSAIRWYRNLPAKVETKKGSK